MKFDLYNTNDENTRDISFSRGTLKLLFQIWEFVAIVRDSSETSILRCELALFSSLSNS